MADILHSEGEDDIDFDAIDLCISEKEKEKRAEKRKRDEIAGKRDEIREKMDAIGDDDYDPNDPSMYDSDWEGTYDDAWGPSKIRDNSEGYVLTAAKSSPDGTDDVMEILQKILRNIETLSKRMNTLEEKMNFLIETSTQ